MASKAFSAAELHCTTDIHDGPSKQHVITEVPKPCHVCTAATVLKNLLLRLCCDSHSMEISFPPRLPFLSGFLRPLMMQRRISLTLYFFVALHVASGVHYGFDRFGCFDPDASSAMEALRRFVPFVGATGINLTHSGTARAATSADHKPFDFLTQGKKPSKSPAKGGVAKATVRYWTRPDHFWTPPDLSAFPRDGVIPHKWRPRYNPKQYHLNSLMVVQFEWDRMGERWGYAPLGPWCGLCQTLNKGCRAECQQLCGEHCEGLGTQRFTDEIGCLFCSKDQGYGCRKYAECRNNCDDCAQYEPILQHTDTNFAWGPLKRDLFGQEYRVFPDKEANEPWTRWNNPVTYDRTRVEL